MLIRAINLIIICNVLIFISCIRDNSTDPPLINLDELAWQHTSIDSQRVNMVAADLDDKIFADIGYNGLFFSEDHGLTWQKPAIENYDIAEMAFNPNGDIYATITASLDVGGVLRSKDGGLTWRELSQPAIVPLSIAFHPSGTILFGDGSLGYAFEGAVYKTENDFSTFELTSFPDTIAIYTMRINNIGDIFAGTAKGVYKSSDIGETWIHTNEGLVNMDDPVWKTIISLLVINPVNNYIFALTSSGLFKSIDNGKNWSITGMANMDYILSIVINKDGVLQHIEKWRLLFSRLWKYLDKIK
jgi:photosystem II stability/assembly factor-like uncharacterized protein